MFAIEKFKKKQIEMFWSKKFMGGFNFLFKLKYFFNYLKF